MKAWKTTLISLSIFGIAAGIGAWHYGPHVLEAAASTMSKAKSIYGKVDKRWGQRATGSNKHQEASTSHDGHKNPALPKKQDGKSLYTTVSLPEGPAEHAGHGPLAKPRANQDGSSSMPSMGSGGIMLSAEKQQLMGVTIGQVLRKPLVKVIRTVGTVEPDETRIAQIQTKIKGWIEDLDVDYTGKFVEKGQLLFTLYSPELVATQEEYLLALKAQNYLGKSPFREVSNGGHSIREATRRRLKLWDITDEQIEELERTGKPKVHLAFYSPISGYVTQKHTLKGMAVNPGMPLYTITDLSKVWVLADLYEQEISLVKLGQRAEVTIASYPGEVFHGKVVYIYPYLESATRTVKVRLELDNYDMKLKPKMFANVQIQVDLGHQLAVPDGAVLDSGSRQVAFVSLGKGHFEPRNVTLGPKVDSHYVVLKGLREGEQIATSATFLIDSESQLKSAVGGMSGHQH